MLDETKKEAATAAEGFNPLMVVFNELNNIRAEIRDLRRELKETDVALRQEIKATEAALRQEMTGLRQEIRATEAALRQDLKSSMWTVAGVTVGAVAAVTAVIQVFLR